MIWQTQIMTPKRSQKIRCSYAEYLQVGLNVQKVIIGQLLFREVLPYDMFNNHVFSANEEIAYEWLRCQKYTFGIIGGSGILLYPYWITRVVIQGCTLIKRAIKILAIGKGCNYKGLEVVRLK